MSPKSRGRPKGRGRPIKKRNLASTRPLTLHEQVMIEALYLGHDAPRMAAETAASQWLGEAWVSADMGSATPNATWSRRLSASCQALLTTRHTLLCRTGHHRRTR